MNPFFCGIEQSQVIVIGQKKMLQKIKVNLKIKPTVKVHIKMVIKNNIWIQVSGQLM